MGPVRFSLRPLFGASIVAWVAACGGNSVSHGGGDGMAGMSGSGAFGGSAGTAGSAGSGAKGGSSGTAGTGGSGGASGSGGTGGTGGATECVLGGRCAEGSSCTQAGCCPCTLKCANGVWGQAECANCGQVGCPESPPPDGDACNPCAVPPSCSWDARPVDGPLYTATCVDERWVVHEQWGFCCTTSIDCGTGVCVNGACKVAPSGQCWTDAQCSDGYVCSGAVVCECGALCGAPDQAGACVPKGQGCCVSDADCGATGECVQGVCKERLTEFYACWSTRDCVGGVCVAPRVCPCAADCDAEDAPGNCAFP